MAEGDSTEIVRLETEVEVAETSEAIEPAEPKISPGEYDLEITDVALLHDEVIVEAKVKGVSRRLGRSESPTPVGATIPTAPVGSYLTAEELRAFATVNGFTAEETAAAVAALDKVNDDELFMAGEAMEKANAEIDTETRTWIQDWDDKSFEVEEPKMRSLVEDDEDRERDD